MAVARVRGRWTAIVNYRRDDGSRAQIRRAVPKDRPNTRKEAKALEAELIRQRDEGVNLRADRLPLANYLNDWLRQQSGLRESTRIRYAELIAHVTHHVGRYGVSLLTPLAVVAMYNALRAEGLSEKSILNVHRLLHKALRDAVRWGLATRNVTDLVDAPRPARYEHHVITPDELRRIFDAADGIGYGALVRVAAWTGLRLGELLALTWADIDGDRLTVRRARDTDGRVSAPKTQRSRRTITMSPGTVAVLESLDRGAPDDCVFPLTHNQVNHAWRRIRAVAGTPRARFHDLRHAAATFLLSAGLPITAVSARLGHSQVSTTLNIYSHNLPGADAEIAKVVDHVMR